MPLKLENNQNSHRTLKMTKIPVKLENNQNTHKTFKITKYSQNPKMTKIPLKRPR